MAQCPSQAWDQYHAQQEEDAMYAYERRLRETPIDAVADMIETEEGYEAGWTARIIIEEAQKAQREKDARLLDDLANDLAGTTELAIAATLLQAASKIRSGE